MAVGSMSAPALLALLSATGYEVCFRSAAWVECLVLRDDERWIGNGLSEDAALDDAVARMLPSHVARMLLARATATEPDGEARAHVDQPVPVPIAEPHVIEHVMASVEPASATTDNEAMPQIDEHRGRFRQSRNEALAALDDVARGVDEQLATFARLAPDRQRAFLLIWICRTRSFVEACPRSADVERRAGEVARKLGELAKRFRPGSVRVLQLSARPSDVRTPKQGDAAAPTTWAEAAIVAERLLDEQIAEAEAMGLDADGWSELPKRTRAPARPEQEFANVLRTLDEVLPADVAGATLDDAALATLSEAAEQLRRLRGRVRDAVAWGEAVGRLRALPPGVGRARLRNALDPRFSGRAQRAR